MMRRSMFATRIAFKWRRCPCRQSVQSAEAVWLEAEWAAAVTEFARTHREESELKFALQLSREEAEMAQALEVSQGPLPSSWEEATATARGRGGCCVIQRCHDACCMNVSIDFHLSSASGSGSRTNVTASLRRRFVSSEAPSYPGWEWRLQRSHNASR